MINLRITGHYNRGQQDEYVELEAAARLMWYPSFSTVSRKPIPESIWKTLKSPLNG